MSAPTWTEYLNDLASYLVAMRQVAENGASPPESPRVPSYPIPDGCREQAFRLATECDQLAIEVSARMVAIDCQLSPARRSPHQPFRVARFIDVSS